jgi:hypothetical protein
MCCTNAVWPGVTIVSICFVWCAAQRVHTVCVGMILQDLCTSVFSGVSKMRISS